VKQFGRFRAIPAYILYTYDG